MPLRTELALVGISLAAACGAEGDSGYRRLTEGDAAPSFAAATLAGDTISLADLRGEVVMLNIWATWCIPCRREMPGLQALHERYAERGLHVIGVSIDGSNATESVGRFLEDYGITFTILHDPSDRVTRAFRSMGVPETYLIGRGGRIAKRWIGLFDPEAESTVTAVEAELAEGG